jgi:hypothetical protein
MMRLHSRPGPPDALSRRQCTVKQYDGYWIVEAAIPWSQLSIKPGDEKLKMNAARSLVLRRENEKKVFSVLNHETAGFHSPDAVLTLE